ncbi:MAG: lipocalin-like domain-containing protein [Rhizobiales bacterium]|nr:lipocalin-like domain-containing protein [Hyphomicrobiales bacterium]
MTVPTPLALVLPNPGMTFSQFPLEVVALRGKLARDLRAQQPSELRPQMVGTWSLSEQWVEQDGKKIQRFGASPKGIAIYDGNGRFATILLRADLPKLRPTMR